jgi:hypothetical protein
MTSKLVPSDPAKVMVIREVIPGITTFSTPFWRFGSIKVGGRGTIGKQLPGCDYNDLLSDTKQCV